MKFELGNQPPNNYNEKLYLLFLDGRLAITEEDYQLTLFHPELFIEPRITDSAVYLGSLNDDLIYAAELEQLSDLPPGYSLLPVRDIALQAQAHEFDVISRGQQLMHWQQQHRFCGACGTPTEKDPREIAKICPACNKQWYPRISPCAIVLIKRDNEILLARSHHYPQGLYSLLAGFLEAGETVEGAVHREVFEEVGLKVKNLEYCSSQSWPFPHQLMLGYIADYDSGELNVDTTELADARWFSLDDLPQLPPKATISGQIIELLIDRIKTS